MDHKICFVGTEITPSEGSTFVGGHVNTVVGLCKGLTDLGWEIHIVTTPSRFLKDPAFDFPWAKFHIIHASGWHNSVSYGFDFLVKAVKTIKSLSEKESFELVHAHSGYFGLAVIPASVKKRLGIPAFFSLYCPASMLPCKLPLDSYGIKLLSLGLNKIVAVTANVSSSLKRCGVSPEKIEVIHSCFDEKAFIPNVHNLEKPEEASADISRAKKVLFVGNLDKTKGLDIFLAAARSVLRTNPEAKFVVTLHEPDERLQSLRTVISRSLGSSVEVLGVVSNMAKLMRGVDVVVAPFRSTDGISDIPIIVLEAMALGKPVIASNLEGVKEAIRDGENGFIIDINGPDNLTRAINLLLNNTTLRGEISGQAILSAKRFSYSETSRQLSDLYLRVIETA
jgi:glycosyltransferase involved in cell wall biosynthesis